MKKDKNIVRYRRNGNKWYPVKHECGYCAFKRIKRLIAIESELLCSKHNNERFAIYDPFFEGKYYGQGLPGTIHYEKGMKKRGHECPFWKEAFEEEGEEHDKFLEEKYGKLELCESNIGREYKKE
jgi:hypothetical protein